MTRDHFRTLALGLPETTEGSYMGHPDFRVRGRIFATIQHPDREIGMVKLTPEQQKLLVRAEPGVFEPVNGGWGKRGATSVHLTKARKASLARALMMAWRNTAPKGLAAAFEGRRGSSPG